MCKGCITSSLPSLLLFPPPSLVFVPSPVHLGSLAGQPSLQFTLLQQHPSLRKTCECTGCTECLCVISHPFPSFSLPCTVSDPSSSWKAHLPRELVQGSPLQIKKTVNRRHSKGEQGEGEVFGPQTPSRSVCSVAWSSKVSGTSQAHSAELFSIE